jgi:excisionase family DNA binding protein
VARKKADLGNDRLMNRPEVAAALDVDPSLVITWARRGRLPSVRTPGGGQRRYRESEVQKILAQGGRPPERPRTGRKPRILPPGYLSTADAAQRLNLSEPSVCIWIRSGKLDARRDARDEYEIPETAVEALLREPRSVRAQHRPRWETRRLVWKLHDEGLPRPEIGERLGIAKDTVNYHIKNGRPPSPAGDAPQASE